MNVGMTKGRAKATLLSPRTEKSCAVHTTFIAGESITTATASTASWLGSIGSRSLGRPVALAGTRDWLVNGLGRRLWLTVGIELWVVA